jgi:hypothetical protein
VASEVAIINKVVAGKILLSLHASILLLATQIVRQAVCERRRSHFDAILCEQLIRRSHGNRGGGSSAIGLAATDRDRSQQPRLRRSGTRPLST